MAEKDVVKLVEQHPQLNHSENKKVVSHVQREEDDWILHTIMLEDVSVPFKFKRKKRYRSLQGARVNLTYYPHTEDVAGIPFETFKVVRIRTI
ncbi:MAG: hypothetical protein ACFHVJ_08385 [Aestuariibacter sp.]